MSTKERICLISIFMLASVSMFGLKSLSVGDKVPLFKAPADDGSVWDISKFIGKDYIVIYFFPGAMTSPRMTLKQACSYRDHLSGLASVNAIVVGISGDGIENLKLFKEADSLNFPLLSIKRARLPEVSEFLLARAHQ